MALKVFWASPLPPVRSGVSDYAVEILRPLSMQAQVRVAQPPGPPCELPADLEVEVAPFGEHAREDEVPLVHLGNNPYHEWLIAHCRNAVVVVHDIVLHHLLVEYSKGAPDGTLETALEGAHGAAGHTLADARAYGIRGRLDPFLFPATEVFLRQSRGLVTHSSWGERILNNALPGIPILRVGLPVADPGPVDRSRIRRRLGLSADDKVLMHLGFLTREKGLEVVLAGLAAANRGASRARLVLVGEPAKDSSLKTAARKLGISEQVVETGWLPWESMVTAPAAADLGITLRVPSAGETSAAVLRFLACGTPVAVIGSHQFLEWPAEVAPRITPGPSAVADVARLISKTPIEADRGQARRVYELNHRPEQAAAALVSFVSQLK